MSEDRNWLIPSVAIIALELVGVIVAGSIYDYHYGVPISAHLVIGAIVSCAVMVVMLLYALVSFALKGVESPIESAKELVRSNRGRLIALNCGVIMVSVQMCLLAWSKSMMPHITEMWADPFLAQLDRSIFGTDPWRISHAIFGQSAFIDRAYIVWSTVKFLTLLVLFMLPPSGTRTRAIIAYFLTMLFGYCLQYALPSGGPIFYERLGHGSDFVNLPIPPFASFAGDYLWAEFRGSGNLGTGISAMPSMHVAITAWIGVSAFALDRRAGVIAVAYFVIILIGSVHTGFHYAVDGIVGTFIALAAWYAAPRLIRPEFRAQASVSPLSEA